MKKASLIALLFMMAMTVFAQEEDFSFPVKYKGKSPAISDFIVALVSNDNAGEYLSYIGRQWDLFQRNKQHEGHFTVLKTHNGYVRYEETDDDKYFVTEFRYWNCSDNSNKIVAVSFRSYENGVAFDGQYGGLALYVYNGQTHRMDMLSIGEVEHPDVNTFLDYMLPVEGDDITATANDPEKGECRFVYKWNGNGFTLQK